MKSRLTITLSDSTLRKVDHLIDKKNVRNRSHAIEQLIEQSLKSGVTSAILLAGGADNATEPKALTVIDGKPLVLYTIDLLKKHGVTNLIITTNKSTAALEDLLGDGRTYGLAIAYLYEETPLGTAGAVLAAAKTLGDQDFFVLAGDILTTIDLTDMATFHHHNQALITMAVKPRPAHRAFDNVFVQGHTVVDFQASSADQVVGIVNAGIYLMSAEVLHHFPTKNPAMLEKDVFPSLAKNYTQKVLAYPFQGVWYDISTDQNYQHRTK